MYRWPEHDTFSVMEFVEGTSLLVVADIVRRVFAEHRPKAEFWFEAQRGSDILQIKEYGKGETLLEDITFNFLEHVQKGKVTYESKRAEGRLSATADIAMKAVMEICGGRIRTRGPRGVNEGQLEIERSPDYGKYRLSPFFAAVEKLADFMPLSAACEVVKCAEVPLDRSRLLDIVSGYGLDA